MSEAVYDAIARASSGFVESPAGCGKTEAIVRTVGTFCADTQLILTHTNAGVDALRRRFRDHGVPAAKYHVDTIAGWSWGWVRRYPSNGGYTGSTEIAVWSEVYQSMLNLLQKDFVQRGIRNSYAGIIVDEYQDCTLQMHRLIVALKGLLPCRVLGDELQGIFAFGSDPLVSWADMKADLANDLGTLGEPHRWLKSQNEELGRWLLKARDAIRAGQEPDFRRSLIEIRSVRFCDLGKALIRLTREKDGRICMIGPKARPLPTALETALVKLGYRVLEPNDLAALRQLVVCLVDGPLADKAKALCDFLARAYGGISAEREFVGKISRGEKQRPNRTDRKDLCNTHDAGTTPRLVADLIRYIEEQDGWSCKLRDSVSALKCILEEHLEAGSDIKLLYAEEIARRKHQNRSNIRRSIGSTLLVKGLEFEHAVIVRGPNWTKSWGGHKDLYVALTRGANSVTIVDYTN